LILQNLSKQTKAFYFLSRLEETLAHLADRRTRYFSQEGKRGEKLTFGSPGPGTSPHISGSCQSRGRHRHDACAISRLGPALNNLIGGHIDAITTSVIGVLPCVEAKPRVRLRLRHRALRSASERADDRRARLSGSVMPQWYGLLGPAGMPAEISARSRARS